MMQLSLCTLKLDLICMNATPHWISLFSVPEGQVEGGIHRIASQTCDTAALAWTFKEFIRSRPLATGRRRGLKTGGKARLTFVRDAWQIRSIGYDSRSGYLIGCQNWSNITARKMIRGLWIGRHRVVRKRSSRYCGVSRLEPDGIGHFSPGFQVWRHSTRKGTIVTRPSDEFPPRHGIRSQLRHGPPNYNVPCLQRP
jgi:hypothetical protein